MGENHKAIFHFQQALRINPNDRLAWNNLQIVIAEQ
jgi:Flp pilus assembly protein TadD